MKKIILTAVMMLVTVGSVQALTLEDFVLKQARPKSITSMTPSADPDFYYTIGENGDKVLKVAYKDGAETVVFDSSTARDCKVTQWDGFSLSEDEGKILLWTASEPIYRHSFKADYYVFEVRHNKLTKLTEAGGEEIATLSPDGRMVAYVKDNNIRVKKLDYGSDLAVTDDGVKNKIINGVPDWVYQEEFGMLSSLRWSPDNSVLAFVRWDESEVPMYSMTMYKGECNSNEQYALYPGRFDFKYPVAGEKNSVVSVHSYDVETRVVKTMKLPQSTYYVSDITFGKESSQLMVTTLNRNQNELHIYSVNPRSCVAKSIYSEKSDAWINASIAAQTRYYSDCFITVSERDGYAHLYRYSLEGAQLNQLTNGSENVTQFYGYDEVKKVCYYQSTAGALNRVVKSVDLKGKETLLSAKSGTTLAAFGKGMAYYVSNYSDVATPNRYSVCTSTGKRVRDLELNEDYARVYASGKVPAREFFTMVSDGVDLNGYLIKPSDFDPSKKYPVIMSQYSGPGSQQVLNKWVVDWENYFAMQGYVVACVDGRGTGGRGRDFQNVVYMHLGRYETIDQIAAARYVSSLPFVDSDKIGIWGWSYGGYEVLMAMSQAQSPYAAGVSIAPVTSWKFYDTIYTERYMRTPAENATGYLSSAPLEVADKLKGDLLLMFGSADDNVHIINEMEYAAKLHESRKLFDMMVYPNMNHSINGCDVRYTLYNKVLNFFDSKLKR